MRRFTLTVLATGLLVFAATCSQASECWNCHSSGEFKVQHKKLFDYFVEYGNSVHGLAGLDCSECHGGDPGTEDMAAAHDGVLTSVRYDNIPGMCGECHEEQEQAFSTSNHFSLLASDGSGPNCVTCHGAMEMDFIYGNRVKNTCSFCHNLESGVAADVPERADFILGKINIIKGYRSFVEAHAADRDLVGELSRKYSVLSGKWHRFDLDDVEVETKELLASYRAAKAQAVKDRRAKAGHHE